MLIRVIISLSLIILLLYMMRGKYGQLLSVFRQTSLTVFWLGFLIFIAAVSVASIRMKMIIEAQEIPVTFIEAISLTFIGYFFNNFLPTAIGGDMVKAYYLSKKTSNKIGAFASVFVDRLIGLLTMVFMAFVALLFVDNAAMDRTVRFMIYTITLIAVIILLFMFNRRFARMFSFLLFFLRPIEEKLRKAYGTIN